MYKRKFAGFLAGILTLSNAVQIPLSTVCAEENESYDMNVTVNIKGDKKEISPYIYGVNEFGNGDNIKNITVNAVRQGGNRYTGYNWETNYSNAGEDWHNSSDTNIGDITEGPAAAPQKLSKQCVKRNIPYKITTLQMAGYVSADKAGSVSEAEKAPSDRWYEVKASKGGELSLEPDMDDKTVYMDEYVNYIVNKLGDSTTATGIQGYSLDNEPVLWNDTHPLLHPDEVTNEELVSKSIELAKAVKAVDPKAEIFGPAFWGMLPCMNGSTTEEYTDPDWAAVKDNYTWYLDFYLEQMANAEKEAGMRLLDVIDVHYYAQDCSTEDAILQAARSLYDPTYVENSWLQPWAGQYFPFIPNIKKSVDKYYPGTKIAVSEYNLANISDEKNTGKSVVSAIAEAEALGAFASNDVYFATYWGSLNECPYVESAINLYTNYNGKGDDFGDTLVTAETEDISRSVAFAAIDGDDASKVTMVLANKDKTKSEKAVISLEDAGITYKSAAVYAVTQDHSDIRVIDVQNDVDGNKVTVELPPLSVAQVVISDKETDEKLYEAPDITEKTEVFNYDDLEDSVNGYKMIPLGDVKHLTKAVINTTVTSKTGSSWCGGGGALTFNSLISADGTTFWGAKSYSYSGGTGDNTIVFDGVFTNGDSEDVEAAIGDTYTELQDWWRTSEKDESGADVEVKYNTITLYYIYDNKEPIEPTTTSPATEPSTAPSTNKNVLYGDANLDGKVTMADATAVLQHIGNTEKYGLDAQGMVNADVVGNGDGITGEDALAIQMVDAKLIKQDQLPLVEIPKN